MPSAAALGEHAHGPRRRHARREGGVEPGARGRVQHAEAVRADEPHPGRPADLDDGVLALQAWSAELGEPRAEDGQRPHPALAAGANDLDDGRRGNGDDGEVHRLRQVGDASQRREALHVLRRAVHDVEPAGVAALAQVVEHLPADRPAGARRAHHCHRGRDQQPPRHRHGSRPAALGEAPPRCSARAMSGTGRAATPPRGAPPRESRSPGTSGSCGGCHAAPPPRRPRSPRRAHARRGGRAAASQGRGPGARRRPRTRPPRWARRACGRTRHGRRSGRGGR